MRSVKMHNDGMTKLEKLTWLEDLLKELTHEACESHYKEIRMGIRMVQSLRKALEDDLK